LTNKFESLNGEFETSIKIDSSINKPSIIFKSDEYFYSQGYMISVTDSLGNSIDKSDFIVTEIKHNYLGV